MELFHEYQEKSKNSIILADHMLSVTYNLVRDHKLLFGVLENTFLSVSYAMSSVLHYEKLFKRIPHFEDSFDERFNAFKEVAARYNISIEFIMLIVDLKNLIAIHKESSVEFHKGDKIIMCSENYKMNMISIEDIKKYVFKAKLFIQETTNIISQNDKLFRDRQI